MAEGLANADAREIGQIARIFRCAAGMTRLRLVLLLASGERDTQRISRVLGGVGSKAVAANLQVLYLGGLIKRRTTGAHPSYSLSKAGVGVAHAYHIILDHLGRAGFENSAWVLESAPSGEIQLTPPAGPAAGVANRVDAATLLNHAANPLRLRLLLALMSGGRDSAQLRNELGDVGLVTVSQHLGILRSGDLVGSRRSGKQNTYTLTVNGLSLVQVVRATSSGLSIRRGKLILRPEPIRAGQEDGLDPTSPDGLACLLKTFAHPVRLRILKLLVGAGELCDCQLPEALEISRSMIIASLAVPRRYGLILDRRDGDWIFFRASQSASNLCRSLNVCFGLRLADAGTFEADRQRLQNLSKCPDGTLSGLQAARTTSGAPSGPMRTVGTKSRTA